jgi:glycosyltransferase involved in cell wall biosynthesis
MVDALLLDKTNRYVIITSRDNRDYGRKNAEVLRVGKHFGNLLTRIGSTLVPLLGVESFICKTERKLFESFDLIISPKISLYPHYWLNIPYVITIHDLQEKYFPHFFTLSQKIYRAMTTYRAAVRSCHIICESNYVKDDIIKYLKIPPSKISVIQSPPPLPSCNLVQNEQYIVGVRRKYLLPERYLFYPAQFWHHKNHERLLDAFSLVTKKYGNMHLVLTGGDPSTRPDMLQKDNGAATVEKIGRLGLTQNVHLLGYVDYNDVPGIYILSQMLVVPTLFESVSLPIYEAFCLGVPVCASNVVALPEQVGDAGLLFDPLNPQDIAEKIIEMIENNALRERCIENGIKKTRRLNIENYSKSLVEILNEL